MFAAASGDVGRGRSADRPSAPTSNARESTRGLTAAMFAAARQSRGRDRRARQTRRRPGGRQPTPIDLRDLDRSAFAGVLFGNPAPPKTPGGEAGSVEPGGRNMAPGGRARPGSPGVDRDFSGQRAGAHAGRHDAAPVGRPPGPPRHGPRAARRRRRRQPDQGRRPHQPAAHRDHQRPLRSREGPARPRRRSEPGRGQRRRRRSTRRSTSSGRRAPAVRSRARISIRRCRTSI